MAGIFPPVQKISLNELESEVRATSWDEQFLRLMFNRLLMGRLRYGSKRPSPNQVRYNYTKSVKDKIDLYEKTGNTEHLIDIANYAMLEFRHGTHPNKHFSATDDTDHCQPK